jgi:hypothetical protein
MERQEQMLTRLCAAIGSFDWDLLQLIALPLRLLT